jgi:hypothetical protein
MLVAGNNSRFIAILCLVLLIFGGGAFYYYFLAATATDVKEPAIQPTPTTPIPAPVPKKLPIVEEYADIPRPKMEVGLLSAICPKPIDILMYTTTQIVDFLEKKYKMNHFAVNIGAADGKMADPVYELFAGREWSGVALDREDSIKHLPWPRIKKMTMSVSMENIPQIVKEGQVPYDVDVLKIDIDWRDCSVMDRFLQIIQPKLIIVEANNLVPPPCKVEVGMGGGHYFLKGCSISMSIDIAKKYGYLSLQYEANDMYFIHEKYKYAFRKDSFDKNEVQLYEEGFLNVPGVQAEACPNLGSWWFSYASAKERRDANGSFDKCLTLFWTAMERSGSKVTKEDPWLKIY